ncbi:MAG: hypothetical protein ACI9YL_001085 [Luteibaculaceae bacterium]|jgi:hypothetical protein
MKTKNVLTLAVIGTIALMSCSQNSPVIENSNAKKPAEKGAVVKKENHRYGGWYCPDNLGGFPAVDINDWDKVPVVNGRMPTQEETQNGTSLINVDMEKYPNAKPLDMTMPKLARYFNRSSQKEEIIIIIQAVNVSNDSVVGFRFLNGGNGSAWFKDVKLMSENEIASLSHSKFVTHRVDINAPRDVVWGIMTKPEYAKTFQNIFDKNNSFTANWTSTTNVNFKYQNAGIGTADYAGELYGNMYIQNDSELDDYQYVEKFFLSGNEETGKAKLLIVCGPFGADYENQKFILKNWAKKVKELSEKKG